MRSYTTIKIEILPISLEDQKKIFRQPRKLLDKFLVVNKQYKNLKNLFDKESNIQKQIFLVTLMADFISQATSICARMDLTN